MLKSSERPLSRVYDLVMLDLDGVVYIGPRAVAGAAGHLAAARAEETHLAFVTNNAARTPEAVAAHLDSLGVPATSRDVVTSAQAAARLLEGQVTAGARVLRLGGPGVEEALRERGFQPVDDIADEPEAVVSGYGPEITWQQIVRAAVRIKEGLPWVASNTDMTIPTDVGLGPGHGVLVRMLSEFSGVRPPVAGKPEPPLLQETIDRVGGTRPLMVGDRLDTDMVGAHRAGVDSLLVLTGVTGLDELAAAEPDERPTYLAGDLAGLLSPHPEVRADGDSCWRAGGWTASVARGRVVVDGSGEVDDWWRAVASAAWSHLDEHGQPAEVAGLGPPR